MELKRLHHGDMRGGSSGKGRQEESLNSSPWKGQRWCRRLAKERETGPESIIGRIPLWVPVKTCDLVSAVDF